MTAHAKRACPSCKSSLVRRNANKVYTCQTCQHVWLEPKTSGSGQKAGPVTIGKQMMNWGGVKRTAG